MLNLVSRTGRDMAGRYCTNCGNGLGEHDQFCARCGRPAYEVAAISTPETRVEVSPVEETRRSSPGCLRWLVAAGVVVILLLIAIGTSGNDGGNGRGNSNASRAGKSRADSGTPSASAVSEPTETFTRENYGELFSDPDAHKGAAVNVTGQILGAPEQDSGQVYFQMFADPENVEWNTVVAGDDPGDLAADDYVRVRGSVQGSFEGENAFGSKVLAVAVEEASIEEIEPMEAVDPTRKTFTVGRTDTDQGFSVTVEKIEFAKNSTRVYVTARNNTGRRADFYLFDAGIVQGSTQIDQETPFEYEVEEPQENLQPGVVTNGVVSFGPADPDEPFDLRFEWSSYNYNINPKPLVFQITP